MMLSVHSWKEPEPQPVVSVWLLGSAGLCGALSSAVLADTHDSHSTKGLGAAWSSARKPSASAAAHHSYCAWQQPGGRRSVHSPPQHAHSYGNRHAGKWWWDRLPWVDGHYGDTCQCWTRSWPSATAQGSYRLANQMVGNLFYWHAPLI